MPALHVGVGEGVRTGKHADEDATVTHPTAPRKSKVTVADGRRIVFREFDFHVPVTHDPADIERELGEDAFLAKNDVHEDDPRLLLHGNAAVDDDGVEALES